MEKQTIQNSTTVYTAQILRFTRCHRGQILSCANNGEGQQAIGLGDLPLSPPRDGQQTGSHVGPLWQIIVWLHI